MKGENPHKTQARTVTNKALKNFWKLHFNFDKFVNQESLLTA